MAREQVPVLIVGGGAAGLSLRSSCFSKEFARSSSSGVQTSRGIRGPATSISAHWRYFMASDYPRKFIAPARRPPASLRASG